MTVGPALLDRIVAAALPDEAGRRRMVGVRFEGATFEADVVLDATSFGRDASFDRARFTRRASFAGAAFEGPCRFAGTRFDGETSFDGAGFGSQASFMGAVFSSTASFASATFGGPAWFGGAVAGGDAVFVGARFSGQAGFDRVAFGGRADFDGAVFEADAEFHDATFARPPTFTRAVFGGRQGAPDVGDVAAAVPQTYWTGPPLATWPERVEAAIVDAIVPAALVAVGAVGGLELDHSGHSAPAAVLVAGVGLAALAWILANLVEQGRSGQTAGKRHVGLRLVGVEGQRPVGPARSIARQILHLSDTVPALLGWLWPLADRRRQTFADKLAKTAVVVVGDRPGYRRRAGMWILVGAVVALAVGGLAFAAGPGNWSPVRSALGWPTSARAAVKPPVKRPATAATLSAGDVSAIAAKVKPALVSIRVSMGSMGTSGATGILVTSSGEVITNNHNVSFVDQSVITVQVGGGRFYNAKIVGTDPAHDLAVLQIQRGSGFKTVTIGDSSRLAVKQPVVLVGNTAGDIGSATATSGEIQALGESGSFSDADGTKARTLTGLIRTSVSAAPAFFGAAIVDTAGQVVGIADPDALDLSLDAQHAIPINQAMAIARQIESAKGGAGFG